MAIHAKDKSRLANPTKPNGKSYRLLGLNESGNPYFYWSETPGEYAGYLGPRDPFGLWGFLTHKNTMLDKHKIFIADYETALKLEKLGVVRPCGNCNRDERKRYDADGTMQVNPSAKIE
jgi:hypothetical protein